jgi:hypothetical protein
MRISKVSPPSVKGAPGARGGGTQFSTPLSGQTRPGPLLYARLIDVRPRLTQECNNIQTGKKATANRGGFRYTSHGEKAIWTLIS